MGMNVGSSSGEADVVSTINTTPLVDVMLMVATTSSSPEEDPTFMPMALAP